MRLTEVLARVDVVRRSGPNVEVRGVEYDSRRLQAGSLFVAMRGAMVDGNAFIAAAVERGAVAVVTDSAEAFASGSAAYPRTGFVEVGHGRRALSGVAANLFNHPEEELALIGVTGTNGKTTTAFLLEGMLNSVGRVTVLVGTIEYHVAGRVRPSPHTTPESRDLLELLADGAQAGATEAVMEVSSHALDQGRAWGLPFDVAIFTNLTRDHLDYHGTMAKYFAAKRSLFDASAGEPPRVAVINLDDDLGLEIVEASRIAGSEIFGYGMDVGAFRASGLKMRASGMSFRMETPWGAAEIETALTGRVNVYNLLAASAAAMARGLTPDEVAKGAAGLGCVPGRFQTVDAGQPFTVVVDYAHTDDALQNLITLAREFVFPHGGRVITLFGCGGDRDRSKRPLMGRVAGEGSDLVVVTSDNPRSEEPGAVIEDILPGLQASRADCIVEPDRSLAIRAAIDAARPGDIVLLAGKGHEKVQVLMDGPVPFDDAAKARDALALAGYAAERVR